MSSSDTSPPKSAEPFHAERAQRYDDTIRRVIPGYDALHRMAALILAGAVPDDGRLLVVGAGTGQELEVLGRQHPGWRLSACDPAEGMLAVARARVEAAGLGGRVSFHACTTDALPAAETAFDAATCLLVLHFLADDDGPAGKLALLRAIAARLPPGAPLVLSDMYEDPATPRFERLLRAWVNWQIAEGIDPVQVEKGLVHVRRDIHFVPEARLAQLLDSAGFTPPERFYGAFLFAGYVTHRKD